MSFIWACWTLLAGRRPFWSSKPFRPDFDAFISDGRGLASSNLSRPHFQLVKYFSKLAPSAATPHSLGLDQLPAGSNCMKQSTLPSVFVWLSSDMFNTRTPSWNRAESRQKWDINPLGILLLARFSPSFHYSFHLICLLYVFLLPANSFWRRSWTGKIHSILECIQTKRPVDKGNKFCLGRKGQRDVSEHLFVNNKNETKEQKG